MENYLAEVCPLSRGMMSQSLSPPLQQGVRFLRVHLPTGRSGLVANPLPLPCGRSETYRFTEFRINNFVRFRTRLSTGGATSVWPFTKQDQPAHPPFWPRLISIREPIHSLRWLLTTVTLRCPCQTALQLHRVMLPASPRCPDAPHPAVASDALSVGYS